METTEHISISQMERFSLSALTQGELTSISQHLVDCQTCHRVFVATLRRQKGSSGLSFTLAPEFWLRHEHVDYDQLVALADGTLDAADREIIDTHLNNCAACREDVRSFIAFRDQLEPELSVSYGPAKPKPRIKRATWSNRWRSFAWSPAYAAALVLIIIGLVTVVVVLKRRSGTLEASRTELPQINPTMSPTPHSGNEVVRNASPSPAPVPSGQFPRPSPPVTVKNRPPVTQVENRDVVAIVNDEHGAVRVDRSGTVFGLDDIPQDTRRDVAATLIAQSIKMPATETELAGAPITLRGSDNAPTFKLRSPGRQVMLSDRPSFSWEALPGASRYRVVVGDLKGHEVAKSDELSPDRTTWTPAGSLKRGEIYAWQVEATVDGKKVFAPGTSATQMKFKILSASSALELQHLKQVRSHLALGVFYAREGMVADAEREFQILVRDNPRLPVLKKLLKTIQSWKTE